MKGAKSKMDLQKVKARKSKRLGRGYGSGKGGHTSSRGAKGQKARSKVNVMFEGLKVKKSLLRRLPLQRGKAKFGPKSKKPIVVNVELLNLLDDGSKVNVETLVGAGIVSEKDAKYYGVKILGDGELKKKLNVELPTSSAASSKIIEAGGKIIR